MAQCRRGDVFMINLPRQEGSHIQGGKRPWVVVQNNLGNRFAPTTLLVPLTTKIKRLDLPTHAIVWYDNLECSMAECEQVRVVDQGDNWDYICTLSSDIMSDVDMALRNAFFYERGAENA